MGYQIYKEETKKNWAVIKHDIGNKEGQKFNKTNLRETVFVHLEKRNHTISTIIITSQNVHKMNMSFMTVTMSILKYSGDPL